MVDGADASGVITSVFETLQAVEQPLSDFTLADNSNNSAHLDRTSYEQPDSHAINEA